MTEINDDATYGDGFQIEYAGVYQLVVSASINANHSEDIELAVYKNTNIIPKTQHKFHKGIAVGQYQTLSHTFLLDLVVGDIIHFEFFKEQVAAAASSSPAAPHLEIEHFSANLTSLKGVINLFGSTGPARSIRINRGYWSYCATANTKLVF